MHVKFLALRGFVLFICSFSSVFLVRAESQLPIQVTVDVTDAPRRLLHARLTLPAQPGPLTLVYPKWIPGEHGPTGPIDNLTGLEISANGQQISWRRDEVNMFAFHLTVPPDVSALDVKLDFLATASASGFSAGASTSPNLAIVSWNEVILYPEGKQAADIFFQPSVRLPVGWKYGSALQEIFGLSNADPTIHFETVSLEQLIDSPLLTGRYFAETALAPEISPKHYLDIAADGPEDLKSRPEVITALSNLVRESGPLFKSRHYQNYRFLVTLSDQVAHFGLEHHQSSDDRFIERTYLDDNEALLTADLLPHEFVHSWNGKYRRPAGLATGNYEQAMKGSLLWVYEGLTQYLGEVLAARSGIETSAQYRDALAHNAALLDTRPGRSWRDLNDTAVSAQILDGASNEWDNWRRNVDYYPEGALIWLEVDMKIRKISKNRKSLNDFCVAFYGPAGVTPPSVFPYTVEDVVASLDRIAPNDWAAFFSERLTTKRTAPLGGIQESGYHIVYTDKPNDFTQAVEATGGSVVAWWSIGAYVGTNSKGEETGKVGDVLLGSPADRAGLGPGMEIVAVNGRQFSGGLLKDALTAAKGSDQPIELIVSNAGYYKVVRLDYHQGLRYPHLERLAGALDILADVLKPMRDGVAKEKLKD